MKKQAIISSKILPGILVIVGSALLLLALLQLPVSMFVQNTHPSPPWSTLRQTAEGLEVTPRMLARKGGPSPVQRGDIIVSVNGIALDSSSHQRGTWSSLQSALEVGDTLHTVILRRGVRFGKSIVLDESMAAAQGDMITVIILLITSIAPTVTLLIALIILIKQPGRRQTTLYFLLSFSLSLYLLVTSTASPYMPWWGALGMAVDWISQISFVMFFPFLLHFLSVFPVDSRSGSSSKSRLLLIYGPFALLAAVTWLVTDFVESPIDMRMYGFIVHGLVALTPLVGVGLLYSKYRKYPPGLTRRLLKTISAGLSVFGISLITLLVMSALHPTWSYSMETALAIRTAAYLGLTFSLPVTFGYAILRYGFLDVRFMFKRSTVYAALAALVILVFIGTYVLLETLFKSFSRNELMLVSVMTTGVAAVLISALKDGVQRLVDRRMFRDEFRTHNELHTLSRDMLNYLEEETLLRALSQDLPKIVRLSGASVVAFGPGGRETVLAGDPVPEGLLQALAGDPSFPAAFDAGDVIDLDVLLSSREEQTMNMFLPVTMRNGEYIGVLLGRKATGRPFTVEDGHSLRSVGEHAALGWKNALMAEEMREQDRIKKEVEIAYKIQSSMLPGSIPEIPGLDIAAVSMPAREVGGDFFDYIYVDDRLGLVVGDVSDKGVSAAMVMASSISTIRFASEYGRSPREILTAANARLYRDTSRQMFVAVCYALLDPRTLELTFTNAGLPKPLLQRGDESFLIDWSDDGSHYALGMMDDPDFHEQQLQLERGDILLLYTDGVAESTNPAEEEFGVKRLRDHLRGCSHLPAQEIVEKLSEAIREFRGQAELFDDLTIVVLKIL